MYVFLQKRNSSLPPLCLESKKCYVKNVALEIISFPRMYVMREIATSILLYKIRTESQQLSTITAKEQRSDMDSSSPLGNSIITHK